MKSILVVEDNKLVLDITTSALQNEDFQVTKSVSAELALKLLEKHSYDLIITDLYMDQMDGLELIEHIREQMQSDVPIMVLSGEGDDDMVIEALVKGADDYVIKPLSVAQLVIRTKKLLGMKPSYDKKHQKITSKINKERVGVVIPCYNEAERLQTRAFQDFVKDNTSYTVCFVNDGSSDHTLDVLQEFRASNPEYIQVLNLEVNSGKAEAVRQGVLHMHDMQMFDYIGFLDADLSTDFQDMRDMIDLIATDRHVAVVGSRISRMGAEIHKSGTRALISHTISKVINAITRMPFQDTQCGAKIFQSSVIDLVFDKAFKSRWLFDVEIFIRLRHELGASMVLDQIYEYPLRRWVHMDGSKLGFKDSLKIFVELFNINRHYTKKAAA